MVEESKSYGLAWFLAGLGVGALVGILYAPKSGRETRDDLANGAREGTEYLKAQVSEYVERGKEAVDRGRAQWEEFVERGKSLVTEQTGRVTSAMDAGRQAYRSTTGSPDVREY